MSAHWTRRLGPIYHLLVALQFLTRIPMPRRLDPETEDLARCAPWFPVVGGLLGALLALAAAGLLRASLSPALTAGLVVALGLMLTGGFHEDGLADTADGLGGGWSRADALRIMKDSRIGTYGGLALIALLGLRFLALTAMQPAAWAPALIAALALGRWSSLGLLRALPYARENEAAPGLARPLVREMSAGRLLAGTLFALALSLSWRPLAGAAALALTLVLVALCGWRLYRRLGGVTGDALGAVNVLCELACLLVFAAASPALASPWVAR